MSAMALAGGDSPLDGLGLDEVEPWIVADSAEARRTLRKEKLRWVGVTDAEGESTGLIRVLSPEALLEKRTSLWAKRIDILSDRNDPWSDYIPATEYPADIDAPYWVKDRARRWRTDEDKGIPEEKRKALPVRCEEQRVDGTRCWQWTHRLDVVRCREHMPMSQRAQENHAHVARRRIAESSLQAVEAIEQLMDEASSEPVRLKAATEILDRAGVRGGVEVDQHVTVEVVDAAREVRDRLERLAVRQLEARAAEVEQAGELEPEPEVVDAEVVGEPQPTYEVMAPPHVSIPDEQP